METYKKDYACGFQDAYNAVSAFRSKLSPDDYNYKDTLEMVADIEDELVEMFQKVYFSQ